MATACLQTGETLSSLARKRLDGTKLDYDALVAERRLLAPLDHPDPAHCLVSLTGLTHLGSAMSRDRMHAANEKEPEKETDSIRMFRLGLTGGKPGPGEIGNQPEWAYKGDGRSIVSPEHDLLQPPFSDDGGEEAEIAGLYIIDGKGNPWRVGFAVGNEFSDHIMEKKNYLYLAHSKLRACSFGPELLPGPLPDDVKGTIRIFRQGQPLWQADFLSGEANMCHSIANLEHHHFKYPQFRRPGDVHVHFFGASAVSFGSQFRTSDGDVFEIDIPLFGRPLRNTLRVTKGYTNVAVKAL